MTAVDWIQFALVIVKGDCLMIKHQCEEQESEVQIYYANCYPRPSQTN